MSAIIANTFRYQELIQNLAAVYFIESRTPEDFQNHSNLIKELISLYTAFATGLARQMSNETWSHSLFLQYICSFCQLTIF